MMLGERPSRIVRASILLFLGFLISPTNGIANQSSRPAERATLESLAGEYDAGMITMTVTVQADGTLTLLFPGQPLYHLQPQTGLRYGIRELPTFAVEFGRDAAGTVTRIQVFQPPPQQNFVAVRRAGERITRDVLQSLVGTYVAGVTQVLVALRPDGVLTY